MGSTYTNMTVKGPSQEAVFAYVADRAAYVSAATSGCVVVLDQLSEWAPEYELLTLATALSMRFSCPVLSVKIEDSDVMAYWLHRNGRLMDWYNSFSGETAPGLMLQGPSGGKPSVLTTTFASGSPDRVAEILKTQHAVGPYASEDRRHADLVDQLLLPKFAVGLGYDYFCRGVASSATLPGFHATSHARC
jgi:hypothetical protein